MGTSYPFKAYGARRPAPGINGMAMKATPATAAALDYVLG
jgi:hypothetical protein